MKKIKVLIASLLILLSVSTQAMPKYVYVPENALTVVTFDPTLVSLSVWLSPAFNGNGGSQINVQAVYSTYFSDYVSAINITVKITTYNRVVGSHTGDVSGDVYLESVASPATYVTGAEEAFGNEFIAPNYSLTSFSYVSYNGLD